MSTPVVGRGRSPVGSQCSLARWVYVNRGRRYRYCTVFICLWVSYHIVNKGCNSRDSITCGGVVLVVVVGNAVG